MIIRELREEEKEQYNEIVHHPMQSWEWGEFKKSTGLVVKRIGFFNQGKLNRALQVTFHPLPIIGKNVGYLPMAFMPDEDQVHTLMELGKKNNALFIKIEPNLARSITSKSAFGPIAKFLVEKGAAIGRPFFSKYTFLLDLTPSEDKLFTNLDSKTRYNVRVAIKKGVEIYENTSEEGMEQYISILQETTKRQKFYAHTPDYFRKIWKSMGQSGILRIFNAVYEDQVLVSWIVFVFNGKLYYPYGSSSSKHRNVMASNLMMWEMIKFGKREGCSIFNMWGALGPDPDPRDPWYGFHKFKSGYGGTLSEYIGTFDLVIDQPLYKIFRIVEKMRWKLLRLKSKLSFF